MHENLAREPDVVGSSDRAFGLVFAGVFGILALWPLVRGHGINLLALGAGIGFFALALLRPRVLAPLNRLWFRFGALLHRLTSPIVLAFIFYAVLLPVALMMRAVGSRPLSLGFDPEARTYWKSRDPVDQAPETMRRQF